MRLHKTVCATLSACASVCVLTAFNLAMSSPALAKSDTAPAAMPSETPEVTTDTTPEAPPIPTPKPTPTPVMPKSFNQGILFPYSYLDKALGNHVDTKGGVDYASLRGDANLNIFIQAIATADLSAFPVLPLKDPVTGVVTQSRRPELVFWINAYNGHVLKTVSDAYPIDKTTEIKEFDSAKTHDIAGTNYSFLELRRKIVAFDARALFALTDGTRSGPLLSPQPYRFRSINTDLNDAVTRFIDDKRNVTIMRLQSKVTLSDYFKTVADTLNVKGGEKKKIEELRKLLATFGQDSNGNYFGANPYSVEFAPADKSLNRQVN